MRITPLDVRKQEFKRVMRGYDADEVRAFLVTLADEYEAVLIDNRQLRERMLETDEKLTEYRNLELALRDTLMTAERVTQETRETARKQGELLIEEARLRVDQVLAEGRAQLDELRREALAVHREKETFLGRFKSLAEAQIHFVAAHRSDFAPLDGRLLDRADPASRAQAVTAGPPAKTKGYDLPDAVDEHRAAGNPETWPRRADLHDRWRDYAIDKPANAPSDQAPRVAAIVSDVVKNASDGGANRAADEGVKAAGSHSARNTADAAPQDAMADALEDSASGATSGGAAGTSFGSMQGIGLGNRVDDARDAGSADAAADPARGVADHVAGGMPRS